MPGTAEATAPVAEGETIEAALCAYSRLIERAVVRRGQDGSLVADVFLSGVVLRGRAGQQGLGDWSVGAALGDPRIAGVLAEALAAVNAARSGGERLALVRIAG
jgi:hypothetical protein